MVIVVAVLACVPRVWREAGLMPPRLRATCAGIGVLVAAHWVAFYGAIVFPLRYYARRRPPAQALRSYVISSAILFGIFVATFLFAKSMGEFATDGTAEIIVMFALFWVGFAILAFIVYGAMSAQRAIRSFSKNVVKI